MVECRACVQYPRKTDLAKTKSFIRKSSLHEMIQVCYFRCRFPNSWIPQIHLAISLFETTWEFSWLCGSQTRNQHTRLDNPSQSICAVCKKGVLRYIILIMLENALIQIKHRFSSNNTKRNDSIMLHSLCCSVVCCSVNYFYLFTFFSL